MDKLRSSLQLALRERRRVVLLFAIWVLVTLVCAVTGPFGTHDALGFGGRLIYWAIAVGLSVASSTLPFKVGSGSLGSQVMIWSGYILILSVVIFGLNSLVFEIWQGIGFLVYLVANVALIVLAVHAVLWLVDYARPAKETPVVDPQTRFLRRLPLERRGPLVRIEAQDHYLNVVTTRGSELILLRLAEAVDELDGAGGLLVHRSHWVALSAVKAHRRDKGRDLLLMSDGSEVPVSRSNKAAAQAAGLF